MTERVKLVADYIEGRGSMTALCEHYGISRRVAYKWVKRFKAEGADGLKERSRAPHSRPSQVSTDVAAALLKAKKAHPCWGLRAPADRDRQDRSIVITKIGAS